LAKGGRFFTSPDSRLLVKGISFEEYDELKAFVREKSVDKFYGDCDSFSRALLLPAQLSFVGTNGIPFIVMENETARLQETAGPEWYVDASYDLKPLPSLSKGLANLLRAMLEGWLAQVPPLGEWSGWKKVRELLVRDLALLKDRQLVDFSLFVHLLRPVGSASPRLPPGLSSGHGCIGEFHGAAIACFRILDFATPYTTLRSLESRWKKDKFDDYTGKFLKQFDCLGSMLQDGCQSYSGHASLESMSGLLRSSRKSAFIGSKAFADNYECRAEAPYLKYVQHLAGRRNCGGRRYCTKTMDHPRWIGSSAISKMLPVKWDFAPDGWNVSVQEQGYSAAYARNLKLLVSPDTGTQSVGGAYAEEVKYVHAKTKVLAAIESNAKHFLPNQSLTRCLDATSDFATASLNPLTKVHKELNNVLWSPEAKTVVVVRGKNKFRSLDRIAREMRQKLCFLRTVFLRCRNKEGSRTFFDYGSSYGDLEVLLMAADSYSPSDFRAWSRSVWQGKACCDKLGLSAGYSDATLVGARRE
jgi:hypothetical protein